VNGEYLPRPDTPFGDSFGCSRGARSVNIQVAGRPEKIAKPPVSRVKRGDLATYRRSPKLCKLSRMKAPFLTALALASGNTAAWILGLRVEAATRWLPAWYRVDHWGDATLVVLATISLYLMSRASLREYLAHCFALFLLWEIPTFLDFVAKFLGPPLPEQVHTSVGPYLGGSMLAITAASVLIAVLRIAPARRKPRVGRRRGPPGQRVRRSI